MRHKKDESLSSLQLLRLKLKSERARLPILGEWMNPSLLQGLLIVSYERVSNN